MRVRVTVDPGQRPDDADVLLIPVPIDTAEQRFVGFGGAGWQLEPVTCANGPLRAMVARHLPNPATLDLIFAPGEGKTPTPVYHRYDNRFTQAPEDMVAFVDRLVGNCESEEACVRQVVDAVASQFDYGPRNLDYEEPVLVCDMATGNCVDINTILLASLYAADVKAAYVAGYFFKDGIGSVADGMHCWVMTRLGTVCVPWDVAHCLQSGKDPVESGLNPAGGCRVAISSGRGLIYRMGDQDFEISHLAQPHWLRAGGRAEIAAITATLIDAGEADVPIRLAS